MKPLTFAAATLALIVGGVAPASALILKCNVSNAGSSKGWIADNIEIEYEDGSELAMVSDQLILKYGSGIAIGRVKSDSSTRTTFVWEQRIKDTSLQNATIEYRLNYEKKDHQLSMTAKAMGIGRTATGKGSCTF
ncbi:hypothetical protein AB9F26_04870 [Falsihalocynthiibacter sp. BN13B15]|uniref:hypothetical protein n=1 Tax=Falsihalocynthiibacter sp. BN13B15 TaxID=3240871 RepID=UPI00350FB04B